MMIFVTRSPQGISGQYQWSVTASSHGECQVAGGGSLHPQEPKGHNNQHLDHVSRFVNVLTFDAQILYFI